MLRKEVMIALFLTMITLDFDNFTALNNDIFAMYIGALDTTSGKLYEALLDKVPTLNNSV